MAVAPEQSRPLQAFKQLADAHNLLQSKYAALMLQHAQLDTEHTQVVKQCREQQMRIVHHEFTIDGLFKENAELKEEVKLQECTIRGLFGDNDEYREDFKAFREQVAAHQLFLMMAENHPRVPPPCPLDCDCELCLRCGH
jgi:superoxide dismutase